MHDQGPHGRQPQPRPGRLTFTVYADYQQFYVGDSTFAGDTGTADFWSSEANERGLAIAAPSLLGVETHRYDWVPVVVEVEDAPPADDLEGWDRVVEASLEIPSGRLAIDGCLSYAPEGLPYQPDGSHVSPHIDVPPGIYLARVYWGGLDRIDEDHYRIVLWPQRPYAEPRVLKGAGG